MTKILLGCVIFVRQQLSVILSQNSRLYFILYVMFHERCVFDYLYIGNKLSEKLFAISNY